jgi:hypothetical protein
VRARVVPEDVDDPSVALSSVGGAADFVVRVGRSLVIHVEFQGYRGPLFRRRLVFYNAGLLKRYPRRRVLSVAIWTTRPSRADSRDKIQVHCVTLEVTSIVLPDCSAEVLLRDEKTVCFAVGADPGDLSVKLLCQRVVEVMVQGQAGEAVWRVAEVVAVAAGRYGELRDAMEQVQMRVKPPLTNDFVRYGIDVGRRKGLRRGRTEGERRGRSQGLLLGLRQALLATYVARFGEPPPELVAAVESTRDPKALIAWQAVVSTRSAAAIAKAVLAGRRPLRG